MGQALYRKYRPRTLKEVLGQSHITDTLTNALQSGSIRHAYLFTGLRGSGKTSIARILAHEINELDYDEEATHLDIIEIDAASNRRIDEIRDLRDKVHIAPSSARYKVYIIDEVHMLTREAFNALLKTLEEPPEHAIFILATTEAHKVPATIMSRTQRFTFKPINLEHIKSHLRTIANKEKITITDEALELLASYGKGSFRDSITMLDQITGYGASEITKESITTLLGVPDDEHMKALLQSVADNDSTQLFESSMTLRENGTDSALSTRRLIELLRDNITTQDISLSPHRSVALMKELLPLTGASSSHEGLEIALLSALEFDEGRGARGAESSSSTKKTTTKPEKKQRNTKEPAMKTEDRVKTETKTNKTEKAATSTEKQTVKKPEATPQETPSSWNDVLTAIKTKNNTLYGILRMAEVVVDGQTITLNFKFEFHNKQLKQQKNMALLQGVISEKLGTGYTLKTTVTSKKSSKEPQAKNKKADSDMISSVSNIFGGAELLES